MSYACPKHCLSAQAGVGVSECKGVIVCYWPMAYPEGFTQRTQINAGKVFA